MSISMAKTTHCTECGTLVYQEETFRGMGWRCGCVQISWRKLNQRVKILERQVENLESSLR